MLVKEGYKQTAVGVIPEEWGVCRIEDVINKFQNGYAFSSKGYEASGIPIISMASISLSGDFQFSYKKCKYWPPSDELSNFEVGTGDLLIAMTDVTPTKNLIGRMALVNIDDVFYLNQRVGLLKVDTSKVNAFFLQKYSNFDVWRKFCIKSSALGAQANLSTKDIKAGRIALPPLPEQQKIAEILSTVDDKLAAIEGEISATETLKKGLMQTLLTQGIGHTQFKDSPLGQIPKSWEVKTAKELVTIKNGFAFKGKYFSENPTDKILLTPGSVKIGGGFNPRKIKYFIGEDYPKSFELQGGDICITLTDLTPQANSLGFPFYVPNNPDVVFLLNQRLGLVSPSKEMVEDFTYYLLCSDAYRKEIVASATGTTVRHSSLPKIYSIKLPKPPINEQIKIAEILSTVDRKLDTLTTKKSHYQTLKKGLMQKLLIGEVRVKVSA